MTSYFQLEREVSFLDGVKIECDLAPRKSRTQNVSTPECFCYR
jgi:hypothetical protein